MHDFAQKQIEENSCPKCASTSVQHPGGAFCTAVGWFGGPDKDPNHWTLDCTCLDCGLVYSKHWVIDTKTVWKTDAERHVLEGGPGCCNTSYLLPCSCGEWLKHSTHNTGYGYQNGIPREPRYWKCAGCGAVQPDHKYGTQYMTEEALEEARINHVPAEPSPVTFTVWEKPGIGVYNPAILRLTLDKDA